ncbi:platelet-activating factor receptor-like [Antedon mediterranea]|uniref:platelet-activating factor receptor-like n=1 Tax=Antedon mediterranea TaxID=105859 RepID=UPI003AF8EE29
MENNTILEEFDWDTEMEPYLRSSLEFIVMYVILPIFAFIGITGNVSIILVLIINKNMYNSLNIYLLNLALSDCLFLLVAPVSFWIMHLDSPFKPNFDQSMYPLEYCKFNAYIINSTCQLSSTFTMAISAERFWAIVKPLEYRRYVSKKRTLKICCVVWIVILLNQSRNLFVFGNERLDFPWPDMTHGVPNSTTICAYCAGFEPSVCEAMDILALVDVILSLFVILLMIIMYGMVFVSIRGTSFNKSERFVVDVSNRVSYEMKALRTVIITVSVYVIFTAPLNTLYIFDKYVFVDDDSIGFFLIVFQLLAFVNSAINPIIYNLSNESYRHALFNVCGVTTTVTTRSGRKKLHLKSSISLSTISSNIG